MSRKLCCRLFSVNSFFRKMFSVHMCFIFIILQDLNFIFRLAFVINCTFLHYDLLWSVNEVAFFFLMVIQMIIVLRPNLFLTAGRVLWPSIIHYSMMTLTVVHIVFFKVFLFCFYMSILVLLSNIYNLLILLSNW